MGGGGLVFGLVFFLLALFAALTSSISVLEVATSWAEEKVGGQRAKVTTILGLLAFLIGMLSVLGQNFWSDIHPLGALKIFEGKGILDTFDTLLGTIMLPLMGVFVALFVGWFAHKHDVGAVVFELVQQAFPIGHIEAHAHPRVPTAKVG